MGGEPVTEGNDEIGVWVSQGIVDLRSEASARGGCWWLNFSRGMLLPQKTVAFSVQNQAKTGPDIKVYPTVVVRER